MSEINFDIAFERLTGNRPFPWQRDLYEIWFSKGKFPDACTLPTGLGKTSVVAIWLIALANAPDRVPRRLVYVVNRRTVVDQTTTEAERLRHNATAAGISIPAISTLRGQFADNREWSADPSKPAIIAGTVDMIGSRLLFSGYGIGFKSRPLHAGFLGQDVLLVHDEAHLEPAFQELLATIQREQHEKERADKLPWPKLRVMELTATSRGRGTVFALSDKDRAEPEIRRRIHAKKTIHLHENKDEKRLADDIAGLAQEHKEGRRAVLVFVRKVDDVDKIVKKLPKDSFEQLTGTLRGLERDALVKKPFFQRFLPESNRDTGVTPAEGTVYLVCTSAGEVGVNISADHLVCDLSTFDSMAQRFGRVNRFGNCSDTRIDIVYPQSFDEKDDHESRLKKTLALLRLSNGDGSPAALAELHQKAMSEGSAIETMSTDRTAALREYVLASYAPQPKILPVSDILFDAWALTTIRGKLPGRPMVEPYLHGISGWEPPETHVGWREEVGVITGTLLEGSDPADLLEDYPLKPHELLRDNSNRVFDRLKKLAADAGTPVWVVADDDTVEVTTLGALLAAGKEDLNYKTVLLPPSAGGLRNGMLASDSATADDVADEWRDEQNARRRYRRVWDDEEAPEGMQLIRVIDTKPDAEEGAEDKSAGRRYWRWYELPKAGDSDGSKANKKPVLWQVHTNDVVNNTERFVEYLPLADDLKKAVILAAKFHDLGKRRELWQRSIGHPLPKDPQADDWLGKSGGKMKLPDFKTDYRHELGSLIDVLDEKQPAYAEYQTLSDEMKHLVLHLIAVHHGRGRPHFPPEEVFDPEPKGRNVAQIASEVPQRFARLQRRYGRWGLAYLESLLRAADYAASAKPSAFVEEGP